MAQLKSTTVVGNLSVTGKINGTAEAANKLNVSSSLIGSTTQPVFFSNGQPTVCGYSLMANVPAVATSQNGYVLQVVNGQLTPVQLYQYSTTDLTAGSSSLATGCLYFVYE